MKLVSNFNIIIFAISLLCIFLSFKSLSLNQINKNMPKTNPDPPANPSDGVHKRIIDHIKLIAENKMKTSDLLAKKKLSGVLPEGFPEETVQKALETRNDKKRWMEILGIPTEIYRMCLYPFAKVNYVKWCNNNFFGSKNKDETCLYNFCEVCCDHLVFIYQNAAEKNIIGELLELNQQQGIKSIKDIVDTTQIHKCKAECKIRYPVDMPSPMPEPPRDPELGSEKKPAKHCTDIKKWGAKGAKSGVYWIILPSKGPQKVFCDMETDNGGWTLFFNYIHQPGQELLLNGNKLPNDLKTNSHMYLENAGFSIRDAKEIRFFCTEMFKADKKFWHFKTNNVDVVSVAFKGDQTTLKKTSLTNGYISVRPPTNIQGKYNESVEKNKIAKFDVFGDSPSGGFTTTAFGSSTYDAYWTVKGDSPVQDIFECGSSHRLTGEISPEDNPIMVFTHHSIWFRGNPPTPEEARERYVENAKK